MGSMIGRFSILATNPPVMLSSDNDDEEVTIFSDTSEYDIPPQALVLDFNKFMRDNVENIGIIQQQSLAQQVETNRILRMQGQQINQLRHQVQDRTLMLKNTIVEVSEQNSHQVEHLRLEMNHFREQFNLRMEQLEVDLEVSRGREHQRATQAMDHAQKQTQVNVEVAKILDELTTALTERYNQANETAGNVLGNAPQVQNPQPEEVTPDSPEKPDETYRSRSGRAIKKRQLFTNPLPQSSYSKNTDLDDSDFSRPKSSRRPNRSLKFPCPYCFKLLTKDYMQTHVIRTCAVAKKLNVNVNR